ncbi:MAG: trimeric intracellular cation channel family protein [Eubacteriales bacterium]|nr:trimeric intracellular cation channel family protein [Eubacteriales bacterium]
MNLTLLGCFDFIGTIAFAISGAFVGVHKKMDIFGVNVLAITTACGGGLIRDLIVGHIPPRMFVNPFYVCIAAFLANVVFLSLYFHQHMPRKITPFYDEMLFWFDTLGLAAFTVDGVIIGADAGHGNNIFLLVFLGFMTGVGGGALRDVLADQTPDIFIKNIYALASIAGGISMVILYRITGSKNGCMIGSFAVIITLRYLARKYDWNLPRITD